MKNFSIFTNKKEELVKTRNNSGEIQGFTFRDFLLHQNMVFEYEEN